MIKAVKRIIGLCAITSLLALSITSCQQPTGGNNNDTNKPTEQTKPGDTTKPDGDNTQIPEKFKFVLGKSFLVEQGNYSAKVYHFSNSIENNSINVKVKTNVSKDNNSEPLVCTVLDNNIIQFDNTKYSYNVDSANNNKYILHTIIPEVNENKSLSSTENFKIMDSYFKILFFESRNTYDLCIDDKIEDKTKVKIIDRISNKEVIATWKKEGNAENQKITITIGEVVYLLPVNSDKATDISFMEIIPVIDGLSEDDREFLETPIFIGGGFNRVCQNSSNTSSLLYEFSDILSWNMEYFVNAAEGLIRNGNYSILGSLDATKKYIEISYDKNDEKGFYYSIRVVTEIVDGQPTKVKCLDFKTLNEFYDHFKMEAC